MSEKSLNKSTYDYCQSVLKELLKEEHNKYCADCQTKSPQWASWNIGVFICIKCAGIHRNLGVHISKVKSITLDIWNNDHIFMLQKMGNKKANEVYEATLPKNFCRNRLDFMITVLYFVVSKKVARKMYNFSIWLQA
ncbi:hypothetical protein HELRODRAFT_66893 [Helobdella robusta]|uniref:Arf-GAP domain-containing protein n=1 Tax=Helobdella robusta TaxID=6412 RepID=T1FYS6_HELRO|nr:hypothetical protein HELRODRAFT_66893 [Helobdella robusta]ESN98737.1 hypothetical protein HELRODRAFT_66893 [Helobdella robusta]